MRVDTWCSEGPATWHVRLLAGNANAMVRRRAASRAHPMGMWARGRALRTARAASWAVYRCTPRGEHDFSRAGSAPRAHRRSGIGRKGARATSPTVRATRPCCLRRDWCSGSGERLDRAPAERGTICMEECLFPTPPRSPRGGVGLVYQQPIVMGRLSLRRFCLQSFAQVAHRGWFSALR